MKMLRDLLVHRVEAQGQVRGHHGGRVTLGWIVGVGNGVRARAILRLPLRGSRGALCLFPLEAKQDVEKGVVPLGRGGRPGTFKSAADGVYTATRAERVRPT